MSADLKGLCSMATHHLLTELAGEYRSRGRADIGLTNLSGIEAASRVRAGEAWDFIVIAGEAIATLESEGHVVAGSRTGIASSGIAVAVREGAPAPDLSTEAALRSALDGAKRIGYSTGPSGVYLLKLFERWGIAQAIAPRLVQAPAGVAVASLVARGDVDLGLQQLSEMIHSPGITVAGLLPPAAQSITTFSGGVCARATRPDDARDALAFFASPRHDEKRRNHGLQPPPRTSR
jgi:molybdate transport system substrate-binding protein